MKIAMVMGTRPEFIKMSPLIDLCQGKDFFVVHTGQHYSNSLYENTLSDLGLRMPKYDLGIKSSAPNLQSEHVGRIMADLEKTLLQERPDVVMVHGDTNTTLAAAVCVRKLNTSNVKIDLHHVESGLRSFDKTMPEEINRIIVDHLSDVMFAPTEISRSNILHEGIRGPVHVTGNTIVDLIERQRNAFSRSTVLDRLGLEKDNYFLLTLHRVENVDVKENFLNIFAALRDVYEDTGMEIIYPIHPRSRKNIELNRIKIPEFVRVVDPLGVNDFLKLEQDSRLVMTDSGGVQEETCSLGVPCVTIRNNTERPETLHVGANTLGGTSRATIPVAVKKMLDAGRKWHNPLGDGNASKRIMKVLTEDSI